MAGSPGKTSKKYFIAHSLCSFRFVRVDRPDRNERAVSGTGESIEKRPDSMKLFERKKYDFQLKVTIFASIVRLCQLDSLDFF